jgi:hypothetical protein
MPNDGLHWGAVLLVPPRNRLKTGVVAHFRDKAMVYRGQDKIISRIHLEHVSHDVPRTARYVFKSLTRRRCTTDDILILPRAASETV